MQIKSIKEIKKYKSFIHYKWNDFNANTFDNINFIFGENGSGKSAIVKIFKDLSNYKSFEKIFPENATIKINTQDYKFSENTWDQKISNKSILFFDTDFIKENIHIANERRTGQNEQEQKSGKLIIEFDQKAIELNKKQQAAKHEYENKNDEIETFKNINTEILNFELTEKQKELYNKYKDFKQDKIIQEKEKLERQKTELEIQIQQDSKVIKKTVEIANISNLQNINLEFSFSSKEQYQNIFSYDLKEQVRIDAEQELLNKIKNEQAFFAKGIELFQKDSSKCPFCQSPLVISDVEHIIKLYNQIFDNTYKKAKEEFEKKKKELIDELEKIKEIYEELIQEKQQLFLTLKELQEKFSIPEIYSIGEEKSFTDIKTLYIEQLISKLKSLKKSTEEDISEIYNSVQQEVNNIVNLKNELNKIIYEKQKIITDFKKDNTSEKVNERLKKNKEELESIIEKIDFLNSDLIKQQKEKEQITKKIKELEQELTNLKEQYDTAKKEYETYCSSEVFQNTIQKIEEYFNYFSFNFKLRLRPKKIGKRKEIPFSFDIIDENGNYRDFSDGLSEGERHMLSICFFFAFTDIQENKQNKIVILDDPITSLDNNNLYNLVELIQSKANEFSQMFIFTHHLTFFRYLDKKYHHNEETKRFLLIRNKKEFGGSFLCKYDNKSKFIKELKEIEQSIERKARNPNGLDLQLETIKYGQYLRFEIEGLVKNKLLHWNESVFSKLVDGIKNNQKLDDENLNDLKSVYAFCNWSNTSHVGYDEQTSFEQLKNHIEKFLKVYDKINA